VFVMYDARAFGRPQWLLNKFVDKHTEVIENDVSASPYYEVYSAPFPPGQVCLGGNDADGVIEMYWVLVGPDEWKAYDPQSTTVSSRYFDGSSDYVEFSSSVGTYDTVTIDVWVKWNDVKGNHPIMNEDNWNVGDLHYQICCGTNSKFGFDVHPRDPLAYPDDTGDYTFGWQPSADIWYFIAVSYLSTEAKFGPLIQISVDDQFVESSASGGDPIAGPPITFDSPRIGSWVNTESGADDVRRSMDGQISTFRYVHID
jgi:hypothetical protein